MNHLKRIVLLVFIGIGPVIANTQTLVTQRIDSLMKTLYERGQFNGSIIVSVGGKLVYRDAFGVDASKKEFTPSTVSDIASLSKGFTAMAIMMLAEQGKLMYDDPIDKYLPGTGELSKAITIRHLLTHTSGIPDVGDLGIDNQQLTNAIALRTLQNLQANLPAPGQKYQYSNTGYLLLATIVEKITGESFKDFLDKNILQPLGMKSTFLSGLTTGMGGIQSNVDDLLKWEESFYTEKLVKQSTLEAAFTSYPVKEGVSTYGFGWNIGAKDNDKFIWHTGNTGFCRAFIGRLIPGKIAVIILTQSEEDTRRMEITEAVINIVHDKPYKLPRMPIVNELYTIIIKEGITKGIELFNFLKSKYPENYDFGENQINSLGYKLLGMKKYMEAIKIFELYTTEYPQSSNAYDSLADAYYQSGDNDNSTRFYEKALELDPKNLNSMTMLKKLKK